MSKYFKYTIYLLVIVFISACDFFSTRNPEDPDTGRTNFKPATSAQIAIDNFVISINEKNTENFLSCLSDTSFGGFIYYFNPSLEALTRFPELFTNWNKQSEGRTFNSIIAYLSEEKKPEFTLTNTNWEVILPDSAVYLATYSLYIPHNISTTPSKFEGSLQLTLRPNSSQLWSITRWIDVSAKNDSIDSWSILKALFAN
jgi:hypothetical protein